MAWQDRIAWNLQRTHIMDGRWKAARKHFTSRFNTFPPDAGCRSSVIICPALQVFFFVFNHVSSFHCFFSPLFSLSHTLLSSNDGRNLCLDWGLAGLWAWVGG